MKRVEKLLDLLTQRTIEGKVSWKETDFADTYEANFNNYLVRLTPLRTTSSALSSFASVYSRRYKQQSEDLPHILEIYDAQDRLIEEVGKLKSDPPNGVFAYGGVLADDNPNDIEDPNLKYEMKKLYEAVKKQFDEPSAAIDALIEALE
jgi:hypothetical protein